MPGGALAELRQLIGESRIALAEALPPMAAGLFGFMGYDMVRLMERLPAANPDRLGIPDAVFIRPTVMAIFDNIEDRVVIVTPVWPSPELGARAAYDLARERLADVVADFDRALPHRGDWRGASALPEPSSNVTPRPLSRDGRAGQGVHPGRRRLPGRAVAALHPARSICRRSRSIGRCAASIPRRSCSSSISPTSPSSARARRSWSGCATARSSSARSPAPAGAARPGEEDAALAAEMLSDPKELAEHLMLLDLGRNDVGRVAEVGSVRVTEKMVVEYYSHVMHIVSNVEGRIGPGKDALDALIGGFPAGTVSGAPKVRAMEIIDELEPERRNFYAGAVGYFSANGNMDTCIALRTALVKDGRMFVQAGGGVVADSDPEAEYQESCNKARALIRAAEEAVSFARSSS